MLLGRASSLCVRFHGRWNLRRNPTADGLRFAIVVLPFRESSAPDRLRLTRKLLQREIRSRSIKATTIALDFRAALVERKHVAVDHRLLSLHLLEDCLQ